MPLCRALLLGCLLSLGCHSLESMEPAEPSSPAMMLWDEGQAAMRDGRAEEAIHCYERSLTADPALTCNYLSLAAACLECGKEEAACAHLAKHVAAHPDHPAGRAHHAELLFKLK